MNKEQWEVLNEIDACHKAGMGTLSHEVVFVDALCNLNKRLSIIESTLGVDEDEKA